MPDYRLYCLDVASNFTKVHEIDAATDADALRNAREMKLPVKCELWQRGRKVAVLDPHSAV